MAGPLPENEQARLSKLHSYGILDSGADRQFDELALVASIICQAPVALVTLIDHERQWFKAKVGVDLCETPRELAFCAHTILQTDVLEIPDLTKDERFLANPFVLGDPKVRFYAGAPLVTSDDYALGSLCVLDVQPRKLDDNQLKVLGALGRQAVALIELHRNLAKIDALARQKDDFVRIASHDLKNPLQAVLGVAGLFKAVTGVGAVVSEDLCKLMFGLERQANTMKKIIEDYLDFQALDDGQIKIVREEVDLKSLAAFIVEDQRDYAARKQIGLQAQFDGTCAGLQADPARLAQVMSNLVGNAIKFSQAQTEVVVGLCEENGGIRFYVRDGGPGLKEEDRAKLFTKYARLSNKPTGGEKSSGLGLMICKSLIDLHGGKIGADNNPGGGSTFWFTIPR